MSKDETKHTANEGIVLKKKHIIIIVILILFLTAGGIFVGLNWNNWFGEKVPETSQSEISDGKKNLDIDPNAGDWDGSTPENKGGAAKGIKIPGYPSITIAKDTENVRMALMNPEDNPCYFKFEIVLKDKNETIYESKYVPPGKTITDVTLTRPLSEGEYNATIKISTIALDGETPLNGANVETVLIAK